MNAVVAHIPRADGARTRRRLTIAVLEILVAVNAFGGGVYGLADAEAVPRWWLDGSPFHSYVVPSLVLFVAVGGGMAVAAACELRRARHAPTVSIAAGAILMGWIGVEVLVIPFSWLRPRSQRSPSRSSRCRCVEAVGFAAEPAGSVSAAEKYGHDPRASPDVPAAELNDAVCHTVDPTRPPAMSAPSPIRTTVTVDGFHRPPFSTIPVDQVMRARVLTCDPDATLREIALKMVTHRVHAVVVVERDEQGEEHITGIVTDMALAEAAVAGDEPTARELADAAALTVAIDWTLEEAAREMLRTGRPHVIVIDGRGAPIGMLSTLDVARIAAWGHV